jgi:hypothetical protein
LANPERVADGEHDVADFHFIAVGHWNGRQVLGVHFDHRNIRLGIAADYLGSEFATVLEGDFDFIGAVYDVVIRQDVTILAYHDTGTDSFLPLWAEVETALRAAGELIPKKAAQQIVHVGIGCAVIGGVVNLGGGKNFNHTWGDLFNHRCETGVTTDFTRDRPFVYGRRFKLSSFGLLTEGDSRAGEGQRAAQRDGSKPVADMAKYVSHKAMSIDLLVLFTVFMSPFLHQ